MGSYSGNSEIVEVEEEPKPVGVQGNDRKPPVVKLGYGDSTEDDINQLFEGLCLKNLGKGYGTSSQPGTAASSPLRKNTMKRPISVGMTHPMGTTNAESVSLKQALRDLCISKASEMAAMKRLSMSTSSPRISEVGRIKNLYNSVVVETSGYNNPVDVGRKTSSVETSLMTEESKPSSSTDVPHRLQVTKAKVLSQSVHPKAVNEENQSAHTSSRFQALKSPNQSSNSSLPFVSPAMQECSGATLIQHGETSASRRIGTQGLQSPNQSAISFPISAFPIIQNGTRTTQIQNEADSASRKGKSPALKPSTQSYHALQVSGQTTGNDVGTITVHGDSSFESRQVGNQACKTDMVLRVKDVLTASAHSSGSSEDESELDINGPASTKSKSKPMGSKSIRKGKSLTASSSASGSRITKTRTPRLVKSVTRNKGSMKKKINQGSTSVSKIPDEDSDISVVSNTGHLICQKCQCSLNNEIVNSNNGFLPSFSTDVDAKVSINNMSNGVIPNVTPSKGNRIVGRTKRNSKSHEKGEFSQSSKSSIGDFSTSTSNSEESNASRPSCCNRPHMSKDARWEAIRHVKREDGVLSLHHFNLLKKLGCGDIGTVYLAELIGSNCCFAIKVMDNEFLARRKKLPRAQTEREILRMLDHPFLPTLYGQFTADNLSCLVMEYCPGGDLHVLRQKQPGRHFTEPAARFYVAEVLLALEYLHMLGIIYRDLKPENILVREDGHIMLTDFDLSLRCNVSPMLLKSSSTDTVPLEMSGPYRESSCMEPLCIEPPCQVACFTPRLLPAAAKARRLKAEHASQVRSLPQLVAEPTDARSNSFVGTHEYLAPEIIKGEGHGAAVDWWMFGVLLYELLYGRTPFKGSGNEETLANVVLQNLKFPDTPFVSFQARDLIRGLLIKEPENRLGTAKGAAEIKQHPFFEGLNWALIRCTIPPELPNFYEYGFSGAVSDGESGKYLECKATGEHLEFELF